MPSSWSVVVTLLRTLLILVSTVVLLTGSTSQWYQGSDVEAVVAGSSSTSVPQTELRSRLTLHAITSLLLPPLPSPVHGLEECDCAMLSTSLRMFRSLLRAAYRYDKGAEQLYEVQLSFQLNIFHWNPDHPHGFNYTAISCWQGCKEVRRLQVDVSLLSLDDPSETAQYHPNDADELREVLLRQGVLHDHRNTEADFTMYLDGNLLIFPGFLLSVYELLLEPVPAARLPLSTTCTTANCSAAEVLLAQTVEAYRQPQGYFHYNPDITQDQVVVITTLPNAYFCSHSVLLANPAGTQVLQTLYRTQSTFDIHQLTNNSTVIDGVGQIKLRYLPSQYCTLSHAVIEHAFNQANKPTLHYFSILESKQTIFFDLQTEPGESCYCLLVPSGSTMDLSQLAKQFVMVALETLGNALQRNPNTCLDLSISTLSRLTLVAQNIYVTSLNNNQETAVRKPTTAWFIYHLEEKFADPLPHSQGGFHPVNEYQEQIDQFLQERTEIQQNEGGGSRVEDIDSGYVFNTPMHSLFAHFYHRYKSLPFVRQLSLSDSIVFEDDAWYFIPYDVASDTPFGNKARYLPGCPLALDLMAQLQQSPVWRQSQGGKRHILVISTLYSNIITHSTCVNFVLDFCEHCLKLTIEDSAQPRDRSLLPSAAGTDRRQSTLSSTALQSYLQRHFNLVIMPYPSSIHFPLHLTTADIAQHHKGMSRDTLVTFIGTDWSTAEIAYRPLLRQVCESYRQINGRTVCRWVDIIAVGHRARLAATFHQHYHKSTFCLMPRAPTYSRKAVVDAIQCGCIPVIFHLETFHFLHPLHIDFQTASESALYYPGEYLVDIASTEVFFTFLQSIPEEDIAKKQEMLSSISKRLQYSLPLDDYQNLSIEDLSNPSLSTDAFLQTLRMLT